MKNDAKKKDILLKFTYLDSPSSISFLWAAYFSLTAWYSLLDCLKAYKCNKIIDLSHNITVIQFRELPIVIMCLASYNIDSFHDPIIHLVYPPKFLHKHCFLFLLRFTIAPRQVETILTGKIWGVNKMYYGSSEKRKLQSDGCHTDSEKRNPPITSNSRTLNCLFL